MAAENGALSGGKVGGIGDVVRDLPRALADAGWSTTVITPAYGVLHTLGGARLLATLDVPFGAGVINVQVAELPGLDSRVRNIVLEHPQFSPRGAGRIYLDDGSARPYASDAGKFALLCAAAAAYVSGLDKPPDVVHLHDWHAAMYCLLRASSARYTRLQGIRTVYTIHNMAFQGIRPLSGDASSLESWYPDLRYEPAAVVDPRYADCVNAMAVGIRLADAINTVSPAYAREILRPSNASHGYSGGEGLERDLQARAAQGRLVGILNGCDYPKRDRRRPGWRRLLETAAAEFAAWRAKDGGADAVHALAAGRLERMPRRRPANVLTSVGRLTSQKADLFLRPVGTADTALEAILRKLGGNGVLIMVGSGDERLQGRIADIAARYDNFLFVCGYSESFAEMLYAAGDLFLMPSSFEPCGISQMLAMRSGQPCVVHEVGGLKDTVRDGVTGFTFGGDDPGEQARNFVRAVERALHTRADDQDRWLRIRQRAEAERFSWQAAAERYIQELYEPGDR